MVTFVMAFSMVPPWTVMPSRSNLDQSNLDWSNLDWSNLDRLRFMRPAPAKKNFYTNVIENRYSFEKYSKQVQ